MWLAGREILGAIQDEQLSSNFRSLSCIGKLKELQATGQAQVYNRAVTGVFLCLGSEWCVYSVMMTLWDPMAEDGISQTGILEWVAISSSRGFS